MRTSTTGSLLTYRWRSNSCLILVLMTETGRETEYIVWISGACVILSQSYKQEYALICVGVFGAVAKVLGEGGIRQREATNRSNPFSIRSKHASLCFGPIQSCSHCQPTELIGSARSSTYTGVCAGQTE